MVEVPIKLIAHEWNSKKETWNVSYKDASIKIPAPMYTALIRCKITGDDDLRPTNVGKDMFVGPHMIDISRVLKGSWSAVSVMGVEFALPF